MPQERSAHLLCLSAKQEDALRELAAKYANCIEAESEGRLGDICFTAMTGRSHFDERLAITGKNREEIAKKLKGYAVNGDVRAGVSRGVIQTGESSKVAFLFTGQGSQYVGMGKELYASQKVFREAIDTCEEILLKHSQFSLRDVLFNGHQIDETQCTQPALFAIEYALSELWKSFGVQPYLVMGHSVGEYVAACVAGVFSLEDGLKLISARGRLMQALPGEGAMGAIAVSEERVKEAIANHLAKVSIAAVNGPDAVVIAGHTPIVKEILADFEKLKVKVKQLNVSHGFHSPQMDPMLEEFEQIAGEISYSKPAIRFVSNVTGKLVEGDEVSQASYWRRHVREAVMFYEGMKSLGQEGVDKFLEVGPGTTLIGMGRLCLPEAAAEKCVWLSSIRKDANEFEKVAESLGGLYSRGIKFNWSGWEAGFPKRKLVQLPTYAFQRKEYWVEGVTPGLKAASGAGAASSAPQVAVTAPLDKPETSAKQASPAKTAKSNPAIGPFLPKFEATGEADRAQLVQSFLQEEVAKVLGAEASSIVPGKELLSFGMDSLLQVVFRNSLKKALGEELGKLLPTALIASYPTVEGLAKFLLKDVLTPQRIFSLTNPEGSSPAPSAGQANGPGAGGTPGGTQDAKDQNANNGGVVKNLFNLPMNQALDGEFVRLIHPKFQNHPALMEDWGAGPGAFRDFINFYRLFVPELKFEIENLQSVGDTVYVRWNANGIHEGTFRGILPTGRKVTLSGLIEARVLEEKVIEIWGDWDFESFTRQIGTTPDELKDKWRQRKSFTASRSWNPQGKETIVIIPSVNLPGYQGFRESIINLKAADYRVIAVELLGTRRAFEKLRAQPDYGVANEIAAILGVLEDMGVHEPVNFLGWSAHAVVPLELALSYPQVVKSVVLIEPFSPSFTKNETMSPEDQAVFKSSGERGLTPMSMEDVRLEMIESKVFPPQMDFYSIPHFSTLEALVGIYEYRGKVMREYDIDFHKVDACNRPVLFVLGTEGIPLVKKGVNALGERLKKSECLTMSGDHGPHRGLNQPEFIKQITQFILKAESPADSKGGEPIPLIVPKTSQSSSDNEPSQVSELNRRNRRKTGN